MTRPPRTLKNGTFERPRPDIRWVPGEGRVEHEPESVPKYMPAPPRVAVYVSSDIAEAVKAFADKLESEPHWRRRIKKYDPTEVPFA